MTETPEESPDPVQLAFWQEVERMFTEKLKQLSRSIELCLTEDLWEPALILIYSGIDAMSWLNRPADKPENTSIDFVRWVNEFILPESGLTCTAEEVYAARCGLVHSHTAESRWQKDEDRQIRKLFYFRAKDGVTPGLLQLRMNEKYLPLSLNIDHLFWAFHKGIGKFADSLDRDETRARLVGERIQQSYLARGEWLK